MLTHTRSTPKTTSGGKRASLHFKVLLIGNDNGREVQHSHLLKFENRTADGRHARYPTQSNSRLRYDYSRLTPTGHAPSSSPRLRRLQREAAARGESQLSGSRDREPTTGSGDRDSGSRSHTVISGGYTVSSGSYTPSSGSYAPSSGGYVAASRGYTVSSGGYSSSSGGYAASSAGYPASSGGYTSSSGGYASSSRGSTSRAHPDGWYEDPWSPQRMRYYASGQWTSHTR
jgi:hypothetical protein